MRMCTFQHWQSVFWLITIPCGFSHGIVPPAGKTCTQSPVAIVQIPENLGGYRKQSPSWTSNYPGQGIVYIPLGIDLTVVCINLQLLSGPKTLMQPCNKMFQFSSALYNHTK
jgi:hypothetical protein